MAEYIEREALLEDVENSLVFSGRPDRPNPKHVGAKMVVQRIRCAPAADVAPVVHGHWDVRCYCTRDNYTGETDEQFYLQCSECKRKVWECDQTAAMGADYRKLTAAFPFCHCGAKMDGGDGNGI